MKICAACFKELPKEKFSKKQWKLHQHERRCIECIDAGKEIVLEKSWGIRDTPPTVEHSQSTTLLEGAKPGHTVRFQGLKGAAHLNGTEGTLVKFLKKENRWSVRTDVDNSTVSVKPENLILYRNYHVRDKGGYASFCGPGTSGVQTMRANPGAANDPASWASGLSLEDQYEWFSNCYQMRCDDDYAWGGCNLHGPYNPEATPESIAKDFLVYCTLALRAKAIPATWNWETYLKAAPKYIVFAFEKSDARERWGSENYFEGEMGGRSLRYTGTKIYKSAVDNMGDSREHEQAEDEVDTNPVKLQKQLVGKEAWKTFVCDLRKTKRFS